MSATKRMVNVASVGFTPTGGSLTAITGVTNFSIDEGGSLIEFSGDGDHGPTTKVCDFIDPQVTLTFADVSLAMTLSPGLRGSLVFTHLDAINKATTGGGAITYTLANAIVANPVGTQAHRQFGSATATFESWSSDGVTSPLSSTAV